MPEESYVVTKVKTSCVESVGDFCIWGLVPQPHSYTRRDFLGSEYSCRGLLAYDTAWWWV